MRLSVSLPLTCVGLLGVTGVTACDLQVEAGWIREAPPAAASLAAYAILKNSGRRPLQITGFRSRVAGMAMLHETTIDGGMARMRMLPSLTIAAGVPVMLAPGGKHLMLTGLTSLPKAGDHVEIAFTDASGCITHADFVVRALE
jgi:copper(I)-binding protein